MNTTAPAASGTSEKVTNQVCFRLTDSQLAQVEDVQAKQSTEFVRLCRSDVVRRCFEVGLATLTAPAPKPRSSKKTKKHT